MIPKWLVADFAATLMLPDLVDWSAHADCVHPAISWNSSIHVLLPSFPQDFASQQDHLLSLTADPSALQSQPSNDPSSYLFPTSNAFLSDLPSAGTQQQQQQLASQVSWPAGWLAGWSIGRSMDQLVGQFGEVGCMPSLSMLEPTSLAGTICDM